MPFYNPYCISPYKYRVTTILPPRSSCSPCGGWDACYGVGLGPYTVSGHLLPSVSLCNPCGWATTPCSGWGIAKESYGPF